MSKTISESSIDDEVAQTFPASDPVKSVPTSGVKADPDVLHDAPVARTALKILVMAGLQALAAAERDYAAGLPGIAESVDSPDIAGWLRSSLDGSEQRLLRVSQALACFGEAAKSDVSLLEGGGQGQLARIVASKLAGPSRDYAIVVHAFSAERSRLARYEIVMSLATALEADDVVRLLNESLAEGLAATDELGRSLVRMAQDMPGRPVLAADASLLAFAAQQDSDH